MKDNKFSSSLKSLVSPLTSKEFLTDYWEKQVLVINRNKPEYWRELLTLEEVDNIISAGNLMPGELGIVKSNETFRPSPINPHNNDVDVLSIYRYYDDGYTIILNSVNKYVGPLTLLCSELGKEMSIPFQTNLYLTPAGSKGFGPHYDSHCVFILQISGKKKWKIYDRPCVNPTDSMSYEDSQYPSSSHTREFMLNPGDIAYVPRGFVHDAVSQDEPSLHITLGALAFTWSDFLSELTKQICSNDALFRQSLPIDFIQNELALKDAIYIASKFSNKLKSKELISSILTEFKEKVISDRKPILKGQLIQLRSLKNITQETKVFLRPSILFDIKENKNFLKVNYQRISVAFPINYKVPILYALTNEAYKVRDIPGDMDFSLKKNIVKKLVRAGLISIELTN